MFPWPIPNSERATASATPETVVLSPGQQATVTFEPEQSGTEYRLPVVAASKRTDSTYTIMLDDSRVWDAASIPPTDIDDLQPVWLPAKKFETTLKVQITNTAASGGDRTYHILPVGWEI